MHRDHVDRLMEQWARERPELETRALSLVARVVRLERFLDLDMTTLMDRFDLRIGEGRVLSTLRRAGPPYELTPTDLYRGLLLSSGAMTNRLDRLESRGLVRRIPDDEDQRRIRVMLTDAGRELIDEAMDAYTKDLEAKFAFLDPEEHDRLVSLLRVVLIELERDAEA
jgi:DNA-binding MarR family transcriptional regulator